MADANRIVQIRRMHSCTTRSDCRKRDQLDDFIAETMAEFQRQPTPPEIKVKLVSFLRDAEGEGRFDQAFNIMNGGH